MGLMSTCNTTYALKEEVEEAVELQHCLELHLAEAAIRVGLLMGIVMMSITIWPHPACTAF